MKKEYVAICHGDPGFDSMVDVPLFRRSSGKIGAVSKSRAGEYGAREAKTRVRNVATIGGKRHIVLYLPWFEGNKGVVFSMQFTNGVLHKLE